MNIAATSSRHLLHQQPQHSWLIHIREVSCRNSHNNLSCPMKSFFVQRNQHNDLVKPYVFHMKFLPNILQLVLKSSPLWWSTVNHSVNNPASSCCLLCYSSPHQTMALLLLRFITDHLVKIWDKTTSPTSQIKNVLSDDSWWGNQT